MTTVRRMRTFLVVSVLTCLVSTAAVACLWDTDTLQQERERFPNVLELITGKFLRHSKPFYQWRIADRLKRIQSDPDDLTLYDDLAVAYDKTGQHERAIETMLKKDAIQPDLYETEANLGTFHVHAGNLEEGLQHINRAIEINPDAHFGREEYQKLLVEYILNCQVDGKTVLPLADAGSIGFADFLMQKKRPESILAETQQAVQGVLGMMRFGNHDSPILLEALASLLLFPNDNLQTEDAIRLAARAYLKASYEVEEPAVQNAYRARAARHLRVQDMTSPDDPGVQVAPFENGFRRELAQAEAWFARVANDEEQWIAANDDVDAKFNAKYRRQPTTISAPQHARNVKIVTVLTIGVAGFLALRLYLQSFRSKRTATP